MQGMVDANELAGIVTVVARHGKIVQFETFGMQDVDADDPDGQGHHHAHLLDEQADRRRGADDALRPGQVQARGSGREVHPRARQPQGRQVRRRRRQPGGRGSRPQDDDPRAGEPHRRPHLRLLLALAGRHPLPEGEHPRPQLDAQGVRHQAGQDPAAPAAGDALALQRLGRRAGLPGRGALRQVVRPVPEGDHLRAARHEGHRVLGAAREGRRASRRCTSRTRTASS